MKITHEQLKQIIKEELQNVLQEFSPEKGRDFDKEFKELIQNYTFQGVNYFNALQLAMGKGLEGSTSRELLNKQNHIAHNLLMRSKKIMNDMKMMARYNYGGGPLAYDHPEFLEKGQKIFNALQQAVEENDNSPYPPTAKPSGDPNNPFGETEPPYKQLATAAMQWLEQLEKLVGDAVTQS
tara:strand:+ start:158 stop:700 length:543 start_codon:yes stop_codon:yes gene_type:complete